MRGSEMLNSNVSLQEEIGYGRWRGSLLQKSALAYSKQRRGDSTNSAISGKWSEASRARGERCTIKLSKYVTRHRRSKCETTL